MSTDEAAVVDGRYALEDVLGHGGMADVYRATDLVLGRVVAVKLLREVTAEGSERERFTSEARTLAALNHPNLTTVLDAGVAGERPYLVMELVDGPTLGECCAGTALERRRVVHIGGQLADALAYAHGSGVIHRDVKPSNVLLAEDDRTLLTDFGIARLLNQTTHHTRSGTTIGSPAYLAPEQVRGEPPSTAVDIYSLGLVILEALTGRRAYPGPPTEAALARLTRAPELPRALPDRWRRLLADMTHSDPDQRPIASDVATRIRDLPTDAPDVEGETRVLTQAVHPPGLDASGPLAPSSSAETHVLQTPPAWRNRSVEAAARARDRISTAVARVRLERLLRPYAAIVGLLVAAALLMFVVAAVSSDNLAGPENEIPAGVPTTFQDPLADLHAAINGDPS